MTTATTTNSIVQLVIHGVVTVAVVAGTVLLTALGKLDIAATVPLLTAALGAQTASTLKAI